MLKYSCWVSTKDNGKAGVSTCISENSLSELLGKTFKDATYYLGLGYEVKLTQINSHCGRCYGDGIVRKGLKSTMIRCPECKGKGKTNQVLEDIPIEQSNQVSITMI